MGRRYESFHFGVVNAGTRIVGGAFILVGTVFLLAAAVSDENRWLYAIVGILALVAGVAFLLVKATSRADVEDFLAGRPETPRTGNYEKKK